MELNRDFFILTATHAAHGSPASPANIARNAELRDRLDYIAATARDFDIARVAVEPVQGVYKGDPDGQSFLVQISHLQHPGLVTHFHKIMRQLAAQFDQESILDNTGLVTPDGGLLATISGSAIVGPAALAEDFYTIREDGTPFSFPLQFPAA